MFLACENYAKYRNIDSKLEDIFAGVFSSFSRKFSSVSNTEMLWFKNKIGNSSYLIRYIFMCICLELSPTTISFTPDVLVTLL